MQKRLLTLAQWAGLGALAGLLCGSASALFLYLLHQATDLRLATPWLPWALPLAGVVLGLAYQAFGKEVLPGNNLVLDRIQDGGPQLPLRMAPMVLVGTVWSHLFGASVGREGTGVQMGASLADSASGWLKLDALRRRHMLAAGVSGGFASVFGTPLAGTVFGLEVVVAGEMDYAALVPCLVAALVGDWTTRAWGIQHQAFPLLAGLELSPLLLIKWLVFAAVVALVAWTFVAATHALKARSAAWLPLLPMRLAVGGLASVAMWQLLGTSDYLGLGTPLLGQTLNGADVPAWAFAAKWGFTVLALGFGFIGGEVTPLFVIGACLGHALAGPLGLPLGLASGVGLAATFAAAANTPVAMTLMAAEMLGAAVLPHAALVAVAARMLSGPRSIYGSQRVRPLDAPHIPSLHPRVAELEVPRHLHAMKKPARRRR